MAIITTAGFMLASARWVGGRVGRTDEARLTTTTTRRKRVNPPRETSLASSELSQPAPSCQPGPSCQTCHRFPRREEYSHRRTQTHTHKHKHIRVGLYSYNLRRWVFFFFFFSFPPQHTVTTWVPAVLAVPRIRQKVNGYGRDGVS